jgi:type II secretory pathway component PulK
VVLVMTVLLIAMLVVVSYAFSFSAAVSLRAARNAREALGCDDGLLSALAYGRGLLMEDRRRGEVDSLDESWAGDDLSCQVGERKYAVRLVDEDRKLNLNLALAPPAKPGKELDLRQALRRLLDRAGGSVGDFERIQTALTPAPASEASDGPAWPRRPLALVDGLRSLAGLSAGLFSRQAQKPALPDLVCAHPATVNVNTAREDVLDALWGSPAVTQALVARRSATPFRAPQEVRDALKDHLEGEMLESSLRRLDVQSRYFEATIRPEDPAAAEDLAALLRRSESSVDVLFIRRVPREAAP